MEQVEKLKQLVELLQAGAIAQAYRAFLAIRGKGGQSLRYKVDGNALLAEKVNGIQNIP